MDWANLIELVWQLRWQDDNMTLRVNSVDLPWEKTLQGSMER